jgi:glucose/arabinose dehydrogenase
VRRAAAALGVAALVIASCGGDDGGDPPGTTTTTTSADAPSGTTGAPTPGDGADRPDLGAVSITLTEVGSLDQPLGMAVLPGGDLVVAEKGGGVVRLPSGERLLDIGDEVSGGREQGLLGIAVHPDGDRLYLSYTNRSGDSEIHEWALGADGTPDADARRPVVERVGQPASNHNGGHITFGPDGALWWGLGDGGASGDRFGNAQDPDTLLGSLLRVDVETGEVEQVAIGLRNPWRFSFDRETGDLWIGDVGQNEVEEIDLLPAGRIDGANLGWPMLEGSRPFSGDDPPDGHVLPVYEYGRDDGLSVAGGVVYRGAAIPALRGAYLFADSYSGFVRAIEVRGGEVTQEVELVSGSDDMIVAFGEDADGEVYLLGLRGPVLRIDPA